MMKVLLEKGATLDARDEEGYTALHCAAEAGQAEAVDVLVKRGAEIEARIAKGRTSMEIAASLGYAGIVRILVQGGATVAPSPAPAPAGNVVEIPAMASAKEKMGKGGLRGRGGEEKAWTDGSTSRRRGRVAGRIR
ncbi:hypothetical protein HPP92_013498 [Vanilla planifolia]|uniref:Uncharacterized protein n=1 Tax=Vanilla planifolia TaxID=51239 RepID=A0A835UWS6_VANPL|nr:hypothetical protein HPP92_013498 [Vanilla planifolia]